MCLKFLALSVQYEFLIIRAYSFIEELFRAGAMQCAAVRTYMSEMREPPHRY